MPHELELSKDNWTYLLLLQLNGEGNEGAASSMALSQLGWGEALDQKFAHPTTIVKLKQACDLVSPAGLEWRLDRRFDMSC